MRGASCVVRSAAYHSPVPRLLVLLVAAFSGWAHQPVQTSSIRGTVTDKQGVSVVAAAVEVRDAATGTRSHTITDAGGKYSFNSLGAGTYIVKVDADGFALSESAPVRVLGGMTSVDLKLGPDEMRAPSTTPRVRALPIDATRPVPSFMVTCTNLSGVELSPDDAQTGIKLDGAVVWPASSPVSTVHIGPISPRVAPGRWWRLVIELQPAGSRSETMRSPHLGEPEMRVRTPVVLTPGSHRVAFSCGGAWSEEVAFTWR